MGNYLISGSEDNRVYLWDINGDGAVAATGEGHQGKKYECMSVWVYECMSVWVYECTSVWVYKCMSLPINLITL